MRIKGQQLYWLALASVPLALAQGNIKSVPAGSNGQGPCDIYAAAHTPCVAAHSTTRALYRSYNGPLYQVKRTSDGKALDIGILPTSPGPAGRYANAAAQDAFCARSLCVIN